MRTTKSLRVGSAVAAFALVLGAAGVALADVSTERPGSILIFPKVVSTVDQETVIQISNTRSFTVHARCFYVNAAVDPNTLEREWQVTDFYLWLTRQQPTSWSAGFGRRIDPSDNSGVSVRACRVGDPCPPPWPANAGIDPGAVPPVVPGFEGALLCAEVDASDVPQANNALKGEATVRDRNGGDVSKYNALAIQGIGPDSDNLLALDNAEYNGCPAELHYALIADEAPDPAVQGFGNGGLCSGGANDGQPCSLLGTDCLVGGGTCVATSATDSEVLNFITIIPCTNDLESLVPATVDVNWRVVSEFEAQLSGNVEVTCWDRFSVSDPRFGGGPLGPWNYATFGTTYLHGILTPTSQVGALAVVDSVVVDSGLQAASAAANVHMAGNTVTTNLPNIVTPDPPTTEPAIIRLSDP